MRFFNRKGKPSRLRVGECRITVEQTLANEWTAKVESYEEVGGWDCFWHEWVILKAVKNFTTGENIENDFKARSADEACAAARAFLHTYETRKMWKKSWQVCS